MFVLTAKVSKTKIAAVITILIAIIVLIVVLVSGKTAETTTVNADTNEARLTFLSQYGWSANAEPVQTQQVMIPDAGENEVFTRYNALQQSQGFDLTRYAGKKLTRYVYEILNYPDATDPVYATLFVYKGQVVGGDVTDTSPEGLIHGFSMPS